MVLYTDGTNQFGHKKFGGIGDQLSEAIKLISSQFNYGKQINTMNKRLGYLACSGDPDAPCSIATMAFGDLALNLILENRVGLLGDSLPNGKRRITGYLRPGQIVKLDAGPLDLAVP